MPKGRAWTAAFAVAAMLFGVASRAAESVPVQRFGARCDGEADDTAAIQAAIDSVADGATPAEVRLPGGVCVITAPLTVPRRAYFGGSGAGTVIRADFARWSSKHLVALDLDTRPATQAVVFATMHRLFSGFTVEAVGHKPDQATTAIAIRTSVEIPVGDAVKFAFIGGFRDVTVRNFDLGMDIREMWNSIVDHVAMTGCRSGIRIRGKSVNVQFTHLMLTNFDTRGPSLGFGIDSGFHYQGGTEGRPEGIALSNSLVFGANHAVVVARVLKGDVIDNILDGALKSAVVLSAGDQVTLRNNYVAAATAEADGVQVAAAGSVMRGLNLLDNHVVSSGGAGIRFVKGGVVREGVRIEGNRFEGASRPILLQSGVDKSSLRGNYGNGNRGPLITLEAGGRGVAIDGNHTADAFPAVVLGAGVQLSPAPGVNTGGR